jgi:tRNA G26 N,N-dimethylase Trm1
MGGGLGGSNVLQLKGKAIVDANDMDPSVVESMKRNIEFNDLQAEVIPHCADARVLMVQNAGVCTASLLCV